MRLDELRALDHEDRVTMLVGRLSREAVDLEVALRSSVAAMRGASVSPLHGELRFSDEVSVARRLVRTHAEPRIVKAALDALDRASVAYNDRSRFVHDLLIVDASGQIDRVRLVNGQAVIEPARSAIDVLDIEQAVLDTLHATWRMRAIGLCWKMSASNVTHWLYILEGYGEVDWDGTLSWSR